MSAMYNNDNVSWLPDTPFPVPNYLSYFFSLINNTLISSLLLFITIKPNHPPVRNPPDTILAQLDEPVPEVEHPPLGCGSQKYVRLVLPGPLDPPPEELFPDPAAFLVARYCYR